MARRYATYICGLGPLAPEACPQGGPAHEPFPTGYTSGHEYAQLLMFQGWQAHPCPGCERWAIWTHPTLVERPTWPPANNDHLDYEPEGDAADEDDD